MQVRLFLPLERDVDEDVDRATGLLLIDERRVAFDESRLLERSHASQAGGFREADSLRQLTVGDAAVELQCPHDGPVISIQFRSQVQLHGGLSVDGSCYGTAYYCAIVVILHEFCQFRPL